MCTVMADSTTKDNLRHWNSCDTLDVDDFDVACVICKAIEDSEEVQNIRVAKLCSETDGTYVFFVGSRVFLRCDTCAGIIHLHCHLNLDPTVDLFLDVIEQVDTRYNCRLCRDNSVAQ